MFYNTTSPQYRQRQAIGAIFDTDSYPRAVEMKSLYEECLGHILQDDSIRFHVLMIPGMWGEHFTAAAGDDPDLDAAVERMTGVEINDLDCIVVLGRKILTASLSEDEMTEIVVADLARHVNTLWPISDRSSGWAGRHLGRTSIVGMLTMAHPVLRGVDGRMERLTSDVVEDMRKSSGYSTTDSLRRENRAAVTAVERICERVTNTNGEYLSLPTRLTDIIEAGRDMLSRVVDDLPARPKGII